MGDWWHNLTPGQGTLLGGLAVLAAGLCAFSTGWLERRAERLRFHYTETRSVYLNALEVGLAVYPPQARPLTPQQREKQAAALLQVDRVLAELFLTGDRVMVSKFTDYLSEAVTGNHAKLDELLRTFRSELAELVPWSRTSALLRGFSPNALTREVRAKQARADWAMIAGFVCMLLLYFGRAWENHWWYRDVLAAAWLVALLYSMYAHITVDRVLRPRRRAASKAENDLPDTKAATDAEAIEPPDAAAQG